jgi:hypothetical protein
MGLLLSAGGLSTEVGAARNCKTLTAGSIPAVASESSDLPRSSGKSLLR